MSNKDDYDEEEEELKPFKIKVEPDGTRISSAEEYEKKIEKSYPIRLPQSREVFEAKILRPESANMLTYRFTNLPRTKNGNFKKDAFKDLTDLADEYIPRIITEPKVSAPPAEDEELLDGVLSTRKISASDQIAILTWASTGELPERIDNKEIDSFREK